MIQTENGNVKSVNAHVEYRVVISVVFLHIKSINTPQQPSRMNENPFCKLLIKTDTTRVAGTTSDL